MLTVCQMLSVSPSFSIGASVLMPVLVVFMSLASWRLLVVRSCRDLNWLGRLDLVMSSVTSPLVIWWCPREVCCGLSPGVSGASIDVFCLDTRPGCLITGLDRCCQHIGVIPRARLTWLFPIDVEVCGRNFRRVQWSRHCKCTVSAV